jgi:uncharacterized protein YggT (Ycf19 family)
LATLFIRLLLVVGFLAYMAGIYLLVHIVFARLIRDPASPVLWFFSVITGPLTRPVRAFLPPGAPQARVRWLALGVCAAIWLLTKVVLVQMGGLSG